MGEGEVCKQILFLLWSKNNRGIERTFSCCLQNCLSWGHWKDIFICGPLLCGETWVNKNHGRQFGDFQKWRCQIILAKATFRTIPAHIIKGQKVAVASCNPMFNWWCVFQLLRIDFYFLIISLKHLNPTW